MLPLSLICALAAAAPGPQLSIVVEADTIIGNVTDFMVGAGIEDVNHELVGGLYSQLLWGESFEEPDSASAQGISSAGSNGLPTWSQAPLRGDGNCSFWLVAGDAQTGTQSQGISGVGCGISNAGLDGGGLAFTAGATYEGYVFVKAPRGTVLSASLVDTEKSLLLATTPLTVGSSGGGGGGNATGWHMLNFSLTPSTSTRCFDEPAHTADSATQAPCHANAENLCITCTGAFQLRVESAPVGRQSAGSPNASNTSAPASALFDMAYLSPGAWNQYRGLPVRADVASRLFDDMRFGALRLGGSMCNSAGYRWKAFTGRAWTRQPYDGTWYRKYASPSWRIFEFLQLCEAAGVLPIVTLNNGETAADAADLVEYAHGDASATEWGSRRADDGHMEPYKPFWVEIGNEQGVSSSFTEDVLRISSAMRQRHRELKLDFRQTFIVGGSPGGFTPSSVVPLSQALDTNGTFADSDVLLDFHIGGDDPGAGVERDWRSIVAVRDQLRQLGSPIRAAVLEENGGRHDMQRALGHARRANRLQCIGDFVRTDTPANGLQVLGRNDNAWDQGQLFMTQNGSYLAPHGMAQRMLGATQQPHIVATSVDLVAVTAPHLDVISVRSADRTSLTLRVVNVDDSNEVSTSIKLCGCQPTSPLAQLAVLSGSPGAQNTPGSPEAISPKHSFVPIQVAGTPDSCSSLALVFKPYSFATVTVACDAAANGNASKFERTRVPNGTTCDSL